jgi:hypothetical protein
MRIYSEASIAENPFAAGRLIENPSILFRELEFYLPTFYCLLCHSKYKSFDSYQHSIFQRQFQLNDCKMLDNQFALVDGFLNNS